MKNDQDNTDSAACWSRRSLLLSAVTMPAAAAALAVTAQAQAQKLAKNVVQYQDTPKDGHMCSGCINFVAPKACKLVDGDISPNGWCVAYAPKAG